jgi:hypothetical protein
MFVLTLLLLLFVTLSALWCKRVRPLTPVLLITWSV